MQQCQFFVFLFSSIQRSNSRLKTKFLPNAVSLRALPTPLAFHPTLCTCGCLPYYYGLSGRLPGWWSLSELDTEISNRLWCVGHQGIRVELLWSSASHLTLVNSSNENCLFLGGLFFISRVRGRRPGLAVCWSMWADSWGSGLMKGVREGDIRAEGGRGIFSSSFALYVLFPLSPAALVD